MHLCQQFDGREVEGRAAVFYSIRRARHWGHMFTKLEDLFKMHSLSFEKVKLMVTDGPPAMVGKQRGD